MFQGCEQCFTGHVPAEVLDWLVFTFQGCQQCFAGHIPPKVLVGLFPHFRAVNKALLDTFQLKPLTGLFSCFRAVNNALLDTYQLKSLDGLLEAGLSEVELARTKDDKLLIKPELGGSEEEAINLDNFALREPYDKVIRCLGFTFDASIFQ